MSYFLFKNTLHDIKIISFYILFVISHMPSTVLKGEENFILVMA